MKKQKEKIIDGVKFVVTPFMAGEAFKLKAFLLRKFGPAFAQALGTLDGGLPEGGKLGDIKLDGNKMAQAVETLMAQLDEDESISLLQRVFRNTVAHIGKHQHVFAEEYFDTSFDIVFSGRIFSVYPVFLLVLEANFPDFFGKVALGIGKKIQGILTSEKGAAESQTGSETLETSES